MIRTIIEFSTSLLGFLKRNRRMLPPGRFRAVKVNLGCGLAIAPGWVNVDGSLNALISSWPTAAHKLLYKATGANRYYTCEEYCSLLGDHVFVHHDLARGLPFIDDSVDVVYSSHFLEHLHRGDAQNLLNESYRVLKKGGMVRVCIPDLAYAISLYDQGEAAKERMLQSYFFVDDKASYYAVHKYMYDFELLEKALKAAGFGDIRKCSYQQGETPDLTVLDNRPDESLFVEARKA